MKKEQQEIDNVLPFIKPGTAGKEPPEGTGKNWLSRMPQGTRFLAQQKSEFSSVLHDFVILTEPTSMPVVLLGENVRTSTMDIKWRDPVKFSDDYRWYITLEVLEPNDGNSNQVRTQPVASDAQSEVIDQLHEEE